MTKEKIIKNENGTYLEMPKDKIKFVNKEAEYLFDTVLELGRLYDENNELKQRIYKAKEFIETNSLDSAEDFDYLFRILDGEE